LLVTQDLAEVAERSSQNYLDLLQLLKTMMNSLEQKLVQTTRLNFQGFSQHYVGS